MRTRHCTLVSLAALALRCGAPPPENSHAAAVLQELSVGPAEASRDRTPRLPTVMLRFDRALAEPGQDSLWLVAGTASASLRSDATRGVLGSANERNRIAARVDWDASMPERVTVRALAPLHPDEAYSLAVTTRVRSREGAPVEAALGHPGAWVEALRVDSPPGVETLATLASPATESAPRVIDRAVVLFDRPVHPRAGALGPVARVYDANGASLPGVSAVLDCASPGRGFDCVTVRVDALLDAASSYAFALGDLVDESDRPVATAGLSFRTGDAVWGPAVTADVPVPCAPDEIVRAPFCVRLLRGGAELRGATDAPASLEVRTADAWAASQLGTEHRVRLEGLAPGALALTVLVRGTDGSVRARYDPDPVDLPALPSLRITEVLARPRGPSSQEFVELLNDGDEPAATAGLFLVSPAGASALPDDGTVAAHGRALVVGHTYDPRGDSQGDPAPAPGTTVLRLAGALASRGLSDRGADLSLRDAGGALISFAPTGDPALAPVPGVSVVRADARFREDDAASWSYDAASGSTPGLPDRVR